MKTLIVYYSFTHNNELLAMHLKRLLSCDVLKIEPIRPRNFLRIFLDIFLNRLPDIQQPALNVASYDNFILIAPIWAAKIASPMRRFIFDQKHLLRRYAFITVCGGGNAKQRDAIVKQLTTGLTSPPISVVELPVTDLLKGKSASVTNYQLKAADLSHFDSTIEQFVKACSPSAISHR